MKVLKGLFVAVLSSSILMLASCGKNKPKELNPDEVIRRTMLKSLSVDSVAFDGNVNFRIRGQKTISGSAYVSGVTHNADRAWSMISKVHIDDPESSLEINLVSQKPSEIYLKINPDADADGKIIQSSGATFGQWWRLGYSSGTSVADKAVTPDPRIIYKYSSILKVTSGGLRADGRYYQYGVSISPVSLAEKNILASWEFKKEAIGEVLIDAESFRLKQVKWALDSVPTPIGEAYLVLDIRFSKYDEAPGLIIPDSSGSSLLDLEAIQNLLQMIELY